MTSIIHLTFDPNYESVVEKLLIEETKCGRLDWWEGDSEHGCCLLCPNPMHDESLSLVTYISQKLINLQAEHAFSLSRHKQFSHF